MFFVRIPCCSPFIGAEGFYDGASSCIIAFRNELNPWKLFSRSQNLVTDLVRLRVTASVVYFERKKEKRKKEGRKRKGLSNLSSLFLSSAFNVTRLVHIFREDSSSYKIGCPARMVRITHVCRNQKLTLHFRCPKAISFASFDQVHVRVRGNYNFESKQKKKGDPTRKQNQDSYVRKKKVEAGNLTRANIFSRHFGTCTAN